MKRIAILSTLTFAHLAAQLALIGAESPLVSQLAFGIIAVDFCARVHALRTTLRIQREFGG